MAYQTVFVANEIAVEHKGVQVYHLYKHDDIDEGPHGYYFGWDEEASIEGEEGFDVRELPLYAEIVEKVKPPFIWIHDREPEPGYQRQSPELQAAWNAFHEAEPSLVAELIRRSLDNGDLKPPKPHVVALLSAQGSACTETALRGDEDTPANRAAVEAQFCCLVFGNDRGADSPDRAMPGTWTDVSDNEAFKQEG